MKWATRSSGMWVYLGTIGNLYDLYVETEPYNIWDLPTGLLVWGPSLTDQEGSRFISTILSATPIDIENRNAIWTAFHMVGVDRGRD